MKLKFVPFCFSLDALSGGIIFCQSQNVSVLAEIEAILCGVLTPHWKVL